MKDVGYSKPKERKIFSRKFRDSIFFHPISRKFKVDIIHAFTNNNHNHHSSRKKIRIMFLINEKTLSVVCAMLHFYAP